MIKFTDEMIMGIPLIDEQHRTLIDFANKSYLCWGSNPSVKSTVESLGFLGNYVTEHFLAEEMLQEEIHYPRCKQHIEIHSEFIRTFHSMCRDFETSGATDYLALAITNTASNWIITHIMMEDLTFGKYYRDNMR